MPPCQRAPPAVHAGAPACEGFQADALPVSFRGRGRLEGVGGIHLSVITNTTRLPPCETAVTGAAGEGAEPLLAASTEAEASEVTVVEPESTQWARGVAEPPPGPRSMQAVGPDGGILAGDDGEPAGPAGGPSRRLLRAPSL